MKLKFKSSFYFFILVSSVALISGFSSCNNTSSKSVNDVDELKHGNSEPATDQKKSKRTIIFFGNSLTAGYGLDEEESFPSLIQDLIDSLNLSYQVVNAGVSGETSAGGLSRVDWILNQDVDIFILELGANDALRGLATDATRSNLQGIIDKVIQKDSAIQIIIAGMKAPPNMGENYANSFESIYTELSQDNGVPLIPFLLEDVAGIPSLNLEDGIHPNPAGQKIVAENVWSILQSVLVSMD